MACVETGCQVGTAGRHKKVAAAAAAKANPKAGQSFITSQARMHAE